MEAGRGEGERGEGERKTPIIVFLSLLPQKYIFHPKVMLQYSHSLFSPRLLLATPRVASQKAQVAGKGTKAASLFLRRR